MENRINVAELLRDCPNGMELDCTMYNKVSLLSVSDREDIIFPIKVIREDGHAVVLTKYGQYTNANFAKCVIFPKGKTTWEGFQRPAKDGDVVVCEERKEVVQMFVVQSEHKEGWGKCYFGYDFECDGFFEENMWEWDRLATEEEKQKLFDTIKKKGYKWNAETKKLEKIVVPEFKDGDVVFYNNTIAIFKEWGDETLFRTYVTKYLSCDSLIDKDVPLFGKGVRKEIRFATEEEKEVLFNAIKKNGYRWNADEKKLEGSVKPEEFKDGDIVYVATKNFHHIIIFKRLDSELHRYVNLSDDQNFYFDEYVVCSKDEIKEIRFATDEEKKKLFDTIRENGYKWDAETKKLEKIVVPVFKVGDKIRYTGYVRDDFNLLVVQLNSECYTVRDSRGIDLTIDYVHQHNYKLVSTKFDINTLKPFDSRVLVRSHDKDLWKPSNWGGYNEQYSSNFPYITAYGAVAQCIPYEGNEHLINTTNDCSEFYKTWKKS